MQLDNDNMPQSYVETIDHISKINLVVDIVGYLIIAIVLLRCISIFRKTT